MSTGLWNLASFLIALIILIAVHEWGHFWVARRCGVKVLRFSLGFGKVLWNKTGQDGTEYSLSLIPLGGYVKMLDERAEPVVPELRHHAFNNKSVGQRAAIIAAGPVANFIFAIFAYWLVFIIGVPGVRPVVGEIAANSIAAEAQIAPGTELKAVDGIETPDWDAVRLQLVDKIGDESTTITVAPFGSDQRRDVKLDLRHWAFEPDKEDPVSSLGIRPRGPQIEPVLENVQPNSAASKAGLQAGDRIVKVDGQPLTQWMTFVTLVRDNPGISLALEVERHGSPLSLTLTPDTKSGGKKAEGFAGVVPKVIPLPDEYKTIRQYGPFNAIVIEADDRKMTELSLIENLQREDLDPIEEAEGYKTLMDNYHLTQEEAAERVGKSRSAVANSLRLLGLCPEVRQMLQNGDLSGGHARALLPLKADLQLDAANLIVKQGLSVRQTEALAKRLSNPKEERKPTNDELIAESYGRLAAQELSDKIGRTCRIVSGKKKGRIELDYYGIDDLNDLLEALAAIKRRKNGGE